MALILFQFFELAILVLTIFLVIVACYLLVLTAAAYYARRRQPAKPGCQRTRFLILVPAHNEEHLLPELLQSLSRLDYPNANYSVHVVADNCSDATTEIARRQGAYVYERFDLKRKGKGFALNWLLSQLERASVSGDAFLILDADSVISSNFLRVMDAHLARGEQVIQAYYSVRNPDRSFTVALRYAALTVLHYLRPLGRTSLGGSAGLKGNGMVFSSDVLVTHSWSADLTEDIQLHMELIRNNYRVTFAPEAKVWAEMPASLGKSQTQNARWETGRLQMAKRYVPLLFRSAVASARRGSWSSVYLFFDTMMEHIIFPFSLLITTSILNFIASAVMLVALNSFNSQAYLIQTGTFVENIAALNVLLSSGVIFAQFIYLMAGLHLDRAPASVYRSLLFAPVYVVWKCWQVAGILLGKQERAWVRTTRNKVQSEETVIQ